MQSTVCGSEERTAWQSAQRSGLLWEGWLVGARDVLSKHAHGEQPIGGYNRSKRQHREKGLDEDRPLHRSLAFAFGMLSGVSLKAALDRELGRFVGTAVGLLVGTAVGSLVIGVSEGTYIIMAVYSYDLSNYGPI